MDTHASLAKRIAQVSLLTGDFRLRSGATSSEYFDKYRFEAEPAIVKAVAAQLAPRLPPTYDALAGLEMGGIPIATMLSQFTGKPSFFVRKKPKTYGTCRFAEGGEVAGKRLLVVEDVVTSGGQIIESTRALRAEGAVVTHVACVIDRQSGGRENLEKEGLALIALFTKDELLR